MCLNCLIIIAHILKFFFLLEVLSGRRSDAIASQKLFYFMDDSYEELHQMIKLK